MKPGYDVVAPIPSCVLMFKQELPLMFPERRAHVQRVAERIFDPFEYLMLRHKAGLLRTDFKQAARQGQLPRALSSAGAEHRPEDARCAAAGARHDGRGDRTLLGHDGTYAVKSEFRAASMKIGAPGDAARARAAAGDHYSQRLPDGRAPDRERAPPHARADASVASCCASPTESKAMPSHAAASSSDLMSLEQYARERPALRARMIEHRRRRQLQLGPHCSWSFEDRHTVQYQVQEMLRAERIFEPAGIAEELAAYNPLIPDGHAISRPRAARISRSRRARAAPGGAARLRARAAGCRCWASSACAAIADEDLERENDEKTSAVHFLRFEFAAADDRGAQGRRGARCRRGSSRVSLRASSRSHRVCGRRCSRISAD